MLRALAATTLLAGVAFAQSAPIYTWVDAEGGEHFTDDRSTIPTGVKVRVTTGDFVSQLAVEKLPPRVVEPAPAAAAPAAAPEDLEEKWRTRFHDLRAKVKELEDEVEVGRKRVEEINGMPLIARTHCGGWGGRGGHGGQPGAWPGQPPPAGQVIVPGGVYAGGCGPSWDHERHKAKLERDRRALARAREDLADLERRAAFESVPLEWRR